MSIRIRKRIMATKHIMVIYRCILEHGLGLFMTFKTQNEWPRVGSDWGKFGL